MAAQASFGLRISPSVVLQNLLRQYPSGGQFFSEALQNAEDTDRATAFRALLDLRRHPAEAVREPAEWRRRLSGEAIVFADNGGFQERDWLSLQRIYNSEKKHSPHEAGMYGMGSRSFFHIADVLYIASRTKLAALDPDERISAGQAYGEIVDVVDQRFDGQAFRDAFPDECAPFVGLFGCDLRSDYRGTIIRAPLRAAAWARECTFQPEPFTLDRAEAIFRDFQETLKDGRVVLFLARVTTIELWRWERDAQEPSCIVRTQLGVSSGHELPRSPSGMAQVRVFLKNFETFAQLQEKLLHLLQGADPSLPEVLDVVVVTTIVGGDAGETASSTWLRRGGFFLEKQHLELVQRCSTVPFVALALPLQGRCATGYAFTYLPLPIETGLPLHLHASFRLADNRRSFWRMARDLEGEHVCWATWNEQLLTKALPIIYAEALELLARQPSLNGDHGYSLWPRLTAVRDEFKGLPKPLVATLAPRLVLATPSGQLVAPTGAIFLETPTAALQSLRADLLRICNARHTMADPPRHVLELLQAHMRLRMEDCMWAFRSAVLPGRDQLDSKLLAKLLLALLEWMGAGQPDLFIKSFGDEIASLAWVPTACKEIRTVRNTFVAACPFSSLHVVRDGRADFARCFDELRLNPAHVWKALRLCGMKDDITWEDAVDEARSVAADRDLERGACLFQHVEGHHLRGDMAKALGELGNPDLQWVPVFAKLDAVASPGPGNPRELRGLRDVFGPHAKPLVWAVAPTLACSGEPRVLLPGRTVSQEPAILVAQVRALAATGTGCPPEVTPATYGHLIVVFQELANRGASELANLLRPLEHEAYMPCLSPYGVSRFALYTPSSSCMQAKHSHQALSPAVGILVHKEVVRRVAQKVGVTEFPAPAVLAASLQTVGDNVDLAVALAMELAEQLQHGAQLPEGAVVMVPTMDGTVCPVSEVYIDDAPWRQRDIKTLHPRIGASSGRALGCTSVRDELARQCEEDVAEGDAFGQEADLVDQVKQLLQEYHGRGDVVLEFLQNTDDFGAERLVFRLDMGTYGREKVVDERAARLQGPALYICSTKPLREEDIRRMQHVGRSEKRLDFASTGRFGVGLNVMYRYCDCPQLAANGKLHFFDLTRNYVARGGMSRGRRFAMEQLRSNFPDSAAPFAPDWLREYPVVFRLALRIAPAPAACRLWDVVSANEFSAVLREIATMADSMLLFTRHVRSLAFYTGETLIAEHSSRIEDAGEQAAHDAFFASVPSSLEAPQSIDSTLKVVKHIRTGSDAPERTVRWLVVHRRSADSGLKRIMQQMLARPHGTALLPHAAAAARIPERPTLLGSGGTLDSGKVCTCLPTGMPSGSRAWVHGCFAWLSSRKSLPLPNAENPETPEAQWNAQLLQGPVAESLRDLILASQDHLGTPPNLDCYFDLFPRRGDDLRNVLAAALFKVSLGSPIYPVPCGGLAPARWAAGPAPLFRRGDLSDEVQDALASDGLDLVTLPQDLLLEYHAGRGSLHLSLSADELCAFLKRRWVEAHGQGVHELPLGGAKLASLSSERLVKELLAFAVKDDWRQRVQRNAVPENHTFEHLQGVPLLLTHAKSLTTFGGTVVKLSTHRDVLPFKKDLFIDKTIYTSMLENADTKIVGVNKQVRKSPLGIRELELKDLLPWRADLERAVLVNFDDPRNKVLREVWSVIGSAASSQWYQPISEWKILPVLTMGGSPAVVPLDSARQCVVLYYMQVVEDVKDKLRAVLLKCGMFVLQENMLVNEKLATKLCSRCVVKDCDLLRLMSELQRERQVLDDLPATGRTHLLEYLAVLVANQVEVQDSKHLPLFKTTNGDFTAMLPGTTYCCIKAGDPHEHSLKRLMPPGAVLLAWPTQRVKPVYEYLNVHICSGEDFMAKFVVPRLPTICQGDPVQAAPFLNQLRAYVCTDVIKSERLTRLASATAFVPTVKGTMVCPTDLTDPFGQAAKHFLKDLQPYVPAQWLQKEGTYMQLLRILGMKTDLSPQLVLLCARSLDAVASDAVSEQVRAKSFDLVEELSGAVLKALPPLCHAVPSELAQAAALRILVVRDTTQAEALGHEVAHRASHCAYNLPWRAAPAKLHPFRDVAFGDIAGLVWTVRPVSDHRLAGGSGAPRLENLLACQPRVLQEWGAFTASSLVPGTLLVEHLQILLSHLPAKDGLATYKAPSFLDGDLQACWALASDRLRDPAQALQLTQLLQQLGRRGGHCVPAQDEDAANCASGLMVLAPAHQCFRKIPALPDDAESRLSGYLHVVHARMDLIAPGVFDALGAREKPTAADYAAVTRRVAEGLALASGTLARCHDEVVCACLQGIARELGKEPGQPNRLPDLHMFSMQKRLMPSSHLLVCEPIRWKRRCAGVPEMHFCNEDHVSTSFWGKARDSFFACAGLQRLCSIVEERRLAGGGGMAELAPTPLVLSVRALLRSGAFRDGLHACLVHAAAKLDHHYGLFTPPSVDEVAAAVTGIECRSGGRELTSALVWKERGDVLPGSEQCHQAFFERGTRVLYLQDAGASPLGGDFVQEAAQALLEALKAARVRFSQCVDRDVLRDVLGCGLEHRAAGIARALEKHDIRGNVEENDCDVLLGPGDDVPEALLLVQSMDEVIREGEYVALEVHGVMKIGVVQSWGDGPKTGEWVNRSYKVEVGEGVGQVVRRQFEVYKIRWAGGAEAEVAQPSLEVVVDASGGGVRDAAEAPIGDDEKVRLVKRQLREMGRMASESDYKAAMRRLFLTHHPDKAGNTPVANLIFRMLRRHEAWYRSRAPGDTDDWLDEEYTVAEEKPVQETRPARSAGGPRARRHGETAGQGRAGAHASWFDEFERDLREAQAREERARAAQLGCGQAAQYVNFVPCSAARFSWSPPRTVDPEKAAHWLQQAELEFLAAGKLAEVSAAGRALPACAVWHCQQSIEMALKSAMLHTCGLAQEEITGTAAHDLPLLVSRLRAADPITEEQRAGRELPLSQEDLGWLKEAYLAARYPNIGQSEVPAFRYDDGDARRALELAESCLRWAARVEDLPEPASRTRLRGDPSAHSPSGTPPPPKRPRAPVAGEATADALCSMTAAAAAVSGSSSVPYLTRPQPDFTPPRRLPLTGVMPPTVEG